MKRWLLCVVALVAWVLPLWSQSSPLRVFLRGGPKTHGPGEHDHPRFVAEWLPLLEERGVKAKGALTFPTAEQLERTDVLVLYAAEGGSIHGEERTNLERFLARGGGIVVLHDAVCGDDPHWFKTVVGGAWEHGHSKWHTADIDLYVTDNRHAITDGAANFRFRDEIYWELHMQPEANVLQVGFHSVFDITPQMWTYEKGPSRAFVSLQGHFHDSFAHAAWRTLLLRGIAWAGRRDVDALLRPGEAAALRYPLGGPTSPEHAHESLRLHPDFEVSLVAAEPQVIKPIAIDWDRRGRMWAALTPGYPFKQESSGIEAHDEIAILVDSNSDGRIDERKTYFRGLDLVTSFVFHRDGVIVGAAPDIWWLRDTDGDDVADTNERLFTGFGYGDTHATFSNLRWGPDGWIYATQGYSGGGSNHVTNSAGRDFGRIGNGLFRFRPDGSAIEMVSSYGSNTWGCTFDEEGELFFTMANGAHLRHVVLPERFLSGNRVDNVASWTDLPDHDRVFPAVVRTEAPYAQIDFVGGFTAAAGSAIYDGGAWPAAWMRSHFVCEPTVNLVHHDVIAPRGTTFGATKAREDEFVSSTDLWFRPVDVRVGPDGALYVLDFYNQAVVHNDTRGPKHGPTNAAIRPDRDHQHGRIWRVQHKAARKLAAAPLNWSEPEAVAALLGRGNAAMRTAAANTIAEARDAKLIDAAAKVAGGSAPAPARIAAAWSLARAGRTHAALEQALRVPAKEPELARAAARIYAEFPALATDESRAALLECVRKGDERAKLLAAAALGECATPQFAGQAMGEVVAALGALDNAWARSLAVRWIARNCASFAGSALAKPEPRSLEMLALAIPAAVARDQAQCSSLLSAVADGGALEARLAVLDGLARGVRSLGENEPAAASASLRRLLADSEDRVATAALRLVATWKLDPRSMGESDEALSRLVQRVGNELVPFDARVTALRLAMGFDATRAKCLALSAQFLEPARAPREQRAVLEALATSDDVAAAALIADRYTDLSSEARDVAFERLLARASWSNALLEHVESGAIVPAELGPQKVHRLRTHPDAGVSQRATKAFERLAGASNAGIDALIAELLPEVDRPGGDRVHGKEVFEKNCSNCHTAFGSGGKVGPELSGIGAHGAGDLLPILLDPNRAVEAAYAEWIVTTIDERNFSGVLVRDTEDGVVLRSTSGDQSIAREEIVSIRNTGRSPMPSGLESIGAEGLRDVIAYLAGDFAYWRVLDLKPVVSSNSLRGMYDSKRDANPLIPARFGVTPFEGVPFELLDPARTDSGSNVLVLKGGLVPDWESKVAKPQRVELKVNAVVQRVHVLGGIAGWGYPYIKDEKPIVKWTWRFADGTSEEHVLKNGVEFADWIGHIDVPGSEHVDGALGPGSSGQVRRFAVELATPRAVDRIVLESYDNELAPTFLALTAELPGAPRRAAATPSAVDALIFGGGSSHDFARWFDTFDLELLRAGGFESLRYTASLNETLRSLELAKALVLCTNQSVDGPEFRAALASHVERGGGLLLLHPATWFNWPEWPDYNARIVGGGSRSHEALGEFEVRVVDASHPLTQGVPATFRITDELYRIERAATDAPVKVLAVGKSLATGGEFPVLWTVERADGRTVGCTLGHDGRAHEHPAFGRIYLNALSWILER